MALFARFASGTCAAFIAGIVVFGGISRSAAAEGQVTFSDPSRVASIGGSITEIVYALGEEARLVARDSTSTYPEAARKLPDVGYMRALSPEGVLSVNPSGILALQGSGPKEAVDVLKKASVPYIEVPEAFDEAGILEKIRIVGEALGAKDKAAKLSDAVKNDIDAARKLTADLEERKRVLFILSVQDGKILGSGSGTAADGIIRLAGAVNAVEGVAGYKQLSDEAVLTARPDVVLMMDRGGDHAAADAELFAHPALASTPAGQANKLIRMDAGYLLGFGPRTAGAVHDLAKALYGEQIKD
jgi:iron complex transport system substrate-binding protein